MSAKAKILVGPSVMGPAPIAKLAKQGFEVVPNPYSRKYTRAELQELLVGVDGILAGLEPLDREVLAASRLKVISRVGSGLANVDIPAAESLGIKVFSTPNGPTLAVAELVVGSLICLLREIQIMNRDLHEGKWTKIVGLQLAGKKIAVVGFGRIGRTVAGMLAGLGAEIIAVDPFLKEGPPGIQVMDLDAAVRTADVITLHCSGEDRVLGPAEFRAMKKGAFVLNAARAGLLDEAALIEALENGTVAGAWLDVFPQEPYKGKLSGMRQVLLTPHVASYTQEGRIKMEMDAVDNLLAGFGIGPVPD
ncbi:MAG: phosphoglycerate dehydrogenase [Fibrobacteres bacterium]|nr:phosphoglycerate dehydrogenase [Fibrobacterota bacterium]